MLNLSLLGHQKKSLTRNSLHLKVLFIRCSSATRVRYKKEELAEEVRLRKLEEQF